MQYVQIPDIGLLPIRKVGEKGAWAYFQGLPKFLGIPYYLRNFKFCRTIHSVPPNKIPLKILEKGSVGIPRDWPNVLGTPYYLGNG